MSCSVSTFSLTTPMVQCKITIIQEINLEHLSFLTENPCLSHKLHSFKNGNEGKDLLNVFSIYHKCRLHSLSLNVSIFTLIKKKYIRYIQGSPLTKYSVSQRYKAVTDKYESKFILSFYVYNV